MTSKFTIQKDGNEYLIIQTINGVDYCEDSLGTRKEAQQWIDDYFAAESSEGWYQLQYAHACGYID